MEAQGIKVLSYPQYCRFRSLQRRIQDGARGPGLQDPHLLALGGIKVLPSTRLMYCRDTFNHPTLESSAGFSWQFSELFSHKPVLSYWINGNVLICLDMALSRGGKKNKQYVIGYLRNVKQDIKVIKTVEKFKTS